MELQTKSRVELDEVTQVTHPPTPHPLSASSLTIERFVTVRSREL